MSQGFTRLFSHANRRRAAIVGARYIVPFRSSEPLTLRRQPSPGLQIGKQAVDLGVPIQPCEALDGVIREELDFRAGDCLRDRKSTRLNSSHMSISYAVFCLKKKITRLVVLGACLEKDGLDGS